MSHNSTPHFHNQPGVAKIKVGSKEFMCVGALPPFDHPHVYIDMGRPTGRLPLLLDALCLRRRRSGMARPMPAECVYRSESRPRPAA